MSENTKRENFRNMKQRKTLSIPAWNVKGLHNQISRARKLAPEADITCFSETWIRPGDESRTLWLTDQNSRPLSRQGSPRGGVAIYMNPLIQYEKIVDYVYEQIQFKAIQVADVTIISTHLSPKILAETLKRTIALWNTIENKFLVIGDLNCRQNSSDKRTTPLGMTLLKQCPRVKWSINATKEPTCILRNGESVMDLILTKGIYTTPVTVVIEHQTVSDHAIIKSTFQAAFTTKRIVSNTPISQRMIATYITTAERIIPIQLIEIKQQIDDANSPIAPKNASQNFTHTFLHAKRFASTQREEN